MERVGAYDAKTHLSRLLHQVAGGQSVAITVHGREVAHLIPAQPLRENPVAVIAALRAARIGVRRGDLSVRDMIEEGRP